MTRRRTTAKRIDALHHFFLRGGKKSLLLLVLVPSATNVTMTTTIQEKPSSTNDTMPSTTTEPTTAELTVDDRNNSSSSGTTSRSERPLSTSNCVDIVMIDHTDLIQFSRINDSANKEELLDENDEEGYHRQLRTELIHKIEQAFGPTGLGIVAITNIPNLDIERQQLLPLGAKIPNIENLQELVHAESLYSVGWSHGKEMLQPGQPDYCKGSYYANPLTDNLLHEIIKRNNDTNETTNDYYSEQAKKHPEFYAPNIWPSTSLPELRDAFCTLGQTLVRVGILVANVCDAYCSDRFNNPNNNSTSQFCLSKTIQESFNCKGRLLHYFAPNQGGDLNGNGKNSDNDDDNTSTTPVHENNNSNNNEATKEQQLWCAWHNDHGSLTGLIPGMYLDELGREVPCPDNQAGLYIMPRRQQQQHTTGSSSCSSLGPVRVQVPTSVAGTSYALYQIGETSQIQSGGLLQATPHAVMMSSSSSGITRESFAVFMEPEFDTELHIPAGKTLDDCIGSSLDDDDDNHNSSSSCTCAGITSIQVPSLKGRYKPGQTFGEFHLATVSAFTTTTQQ